MRRKPPGRLEEKNTALLDAANALKAGKPGALAQLIHS